MNLYRIILFLSVIILNVSGFIDAKRLPPQSSTTELLQLQERFVKALQQENWQEASTLLDHEDARDFADVTIPFPSGMEMDVLQYVMRDGQIDLAKKIIVTVGAYCGTKSNGIEGLGNDIKRAKESLHQMDIQERTETEEDLDKAKEILLLLKKANDICM